MAWRGTTVLNKHTKAVLVFTFSSDEKALATGGEDGLAIVWDTTTGRERAVFSELTEPVIAVAFSKTAARFAFVDTAGKLRVQTLGVDAKPPVYEIGRVRALAFLTESRIRFVDTNGGRVEVKDLDLESNKTTTVTTFTIAHKALCESLSDDGNIVVVGGQVGSTLRLQVTICDLSHKDDVITFDQSGVVLVLKVASDSQHVVSGSWLAGKLVVWNLAKRQIVRSLDTGGSMGRWIALGADDKVILYAYKNMGDDGMGVLWWAWEKQGATMLTNVPGKTKRLAMAVSSDGKLCGCRQRRRNGHTRRYGRAHRAGCSLQIVPNDSVTKLKRGERAANELFTSPLQLPRLCAQCGDGSEWPEC